MMMMMLLLLLLLFVGTTINGPCMILLPTSSMLVEPNCTAIVGSDGDLIVDVPVRKATALRYILSI
jgi:hypothetical protein